MKKQYQSQDKKNFSLDRKLVDRLKIYAAKKGLKMKEIVSILIKDLLEKEGL